MTPSPFVASLAVLVAAAMWGLYWIPVRLLEAEGVGAPVVVALLNAPAGIISGLWMLATWRKQARDLSAILAIGLAAALGLALYGVSLGLTSVIRATMLFYLMPIWATLIGIFWLGEVADWRRWIAIVAGLAGMVLLLWGGASKGLNAGDMIAFLSGWVWAVATALIKRLGQAPIAGMLTVQFFGVALMALALGGMLGQTTGADLWPLPPAAQIAVLASLFGVLPALAMIFWASQYLYPGRVGLLLMAEVVVAVISASLLLPDEALAPLQWLAVVLIVGAAGLEFVPTKWVMLRRNAR